MEFIQCKFSNSLFVKSRFISCRFEDCTFTGCDLSLSTLHNCFFNDVDFKDCKLIGIDWTKTGRPFRVNYENCKINDSIFYNLDLRNIHILNCEARNVDFEKANLSKAVLTNTDFLRTNFTNSDLSFSDFTQAVNYRINPDSCKIKKAKFSLPQALILFEPWDVIIE